MKPFLITYTPRIACRFTNDELTVLIKCSQAHYDDTCKLLSNEVIDLRGNGCGMLTGMVNFHRNTPDGYTLTWRDIDLFCKVLEVHQHLSEAELDIAASLRMDIGRAMTTLRDNQVEERKL